MRTPAIDERTWWSRPGLDVRGGRLHVAGRDAERLARLHGTPAYVHDLVRAQEQATGLRDALEAAGLRGVVRLALKAQREPQLLAFLRERAPWVGIDACSPGEIAWALRHGWTPHEISYTGTNLSDRDLDTIVDAGVHLNVDLLTQLDRVGRRTPGANVGLRVNPRIGASFDGGGQTFYTGERPTKFGIFAEQLNEAIAIAERHDLSIDMVHVHVGDGYLTAQLPVFEETVRRDRDDAASCRRRVPDPRGEHWRRARRAAARRRRTLHLARWAAILARHLGPLDVAIATEPGDFLVKECAVLLAEVVTVEERDGVRFAGLDVGWSQMGERFIYGSLLDLVLCRAADAEPVDRITISGTINEGNDLFAQDYPFPGRRGGRRGRGDRGQELQREHVEPALPSAAGRSDLLHRQDVTMELAVADEWFRAEDAGDGVTRLLEAHVDLLIESNVWHVRGRDADLLVDAANGIGALRPRIESFSEGRPVIAVATHGHFDHVGGLAEFDDRRLHAGDVDLAADPMPLRMRREDFVPDVKEMYEYYGLPLPDLLVTALPDADFDLAAWAPPPVVPTRLVADGDVIDLGDRRFAVLHTPGHTAGSICLLEERTGTLFSGDAIYIDGKLSWDDRAAFVASLERLATLSVERVHAGHARSFDRAEMLETIEIQLRALQV